MHHYVLTTIGLDLRLPVSQPGPSDVNNLLSKKSVRDQKDNDRLNEQLATIQTVKTDLEQKCAEQYKSAEKERAAAIHDRTAINLEKAYHKHYMNLYRVEHAKFSDLREELLVKCQECECLSAQNEELSSTLEPPSLENAIAACANSYLVLSAGLSAQGRRQGRRLRGATGSVPLVDMIEMDGVDSTPGEHHREIPLPSEHVGVQTRLSRLLDVFH